MIDLLAKANVVGTSLGLIVMIAYVFIFTLIIICLIRLAKFLMCAQSEQKLIRMEIGKLSEEVHLISEEIKGKHSS